MFVNGLFNRVEQFLPFLDEEGIVVMGKKEYTHTSSGVDGYGLILYLNTDIDNEQYTYCVELEKQFRMFTKMVANNRPDFKYLFLKIDPKKYGYIIEEL